MYRFLTLLSVFVRPGFHHRRHTYLSRGIHWILKRTGWYAEEDKKIEYVQEFLEEFANLRHDIGDDWSNKTHRARVEYLKHMDALRNSLDGAQLRRMWEEADSRHEDYLEMAPLD